MAGQMREVTYESGQLIFGRGDPGEAMHLVVEGRVRLSVLSVEGKVLSFAHAGRGDIFGEIAPLDGGRRTADATALTDVTTGLLARSSLKSLMEAKPQLAQAAIGCVCQRLRVTSKQIETIVLHSTKVRLALFLLAAVALKVKGRANLQSVAVDLGMSQTELGLLLGASRTKINEALAALEKLGAVHHTAGHIECHVDALRAVAQGDEPHASQS